MMPFI